MDLQALLFVLALIVRAANRPDDYDSDDEFIAQRQSVRQPLINRPPVPATGVPVAGTLDQRPSRNDAWSTRMREKVREFFLNVIKYLGGKHSKKVTLFSSVRKYVDCSETSVF